MARRRRSPVLRNLLRALLAVVVVVVLLAIVGVGAGVLLVDPNHYKPQIIAAVQRATGRQLTLNGPIHIGFGLPPTLVADDIALANAPGGTRPDMLTLRRLEAKVALLPLLTGEVDIVRLDLIDPDLLLETDAEGHGNWQFTPQRPAAGAPATQAATSPSSPAGDRFALQALRVRDGRIAWHDGRTGRTGTVTLPRLDAEGGGPEASLVISGEAVSDGRTLTLNGETGSIARLQDTRATTPWPVQLTAKNDTTRLAVRGSLLRPLQLAGYTLQVDATATDMAIIAPFLPPKMTPPHDLSVSAQVSDTAGEAPEVTAMTLHLGQMTWPGPPAGIGIVRADLSAPGLAKPLHADVQATYQGAPLHLVADVGSLAAALPDAKPGGPVPINLAFDAVGASLTAQGTVVSLPTLAGLDAAVSARVPDLAALSPLAGRTLPNWKQIAFDAHVAGTLAQGVALRQATLVSPLAQLAGNLDIMATPRPSLRGAVQAARIDLDGLIAGLAPAHPESKPAPAVAPAPAAPAGKAHVIPDEPLDFSELDRQDADLQVAVAALQTGGVGYSNIAGHLVLLNGRLTLDPFAGETPGGRLDAKIAIDGHAAEPPVAVSLHAPAIAVQPIAAALGQPDALSGTASVDADLHGAGRTPHAIAASLDGHLGVAVSDGDVSNAFLGAVLGSVLKAAKLPENATGVGGSTKLRCLVLRLDASHGVVTANTLVADTTRLLVQGSGTADLGQETLALHLRPLLRAGPGIVVPVRVTGSFRDPKLASDFGGKGGLLGSLAGIATGEHGGDPCAPALAAVRGPEAPAAPPAAATAAPAEAQPKAKPPKPIDILRGLLH